jgi:ceramide glucosyltransferase
MMMFMSAILAVLLAGSLIYCVLVMVATWRYLAAKLPVRGVVPPISVLKPLSGRHEGLEENLRSFLAQDYPDFEVLLAVHRESDPAIAVAQKVMEEFSGKLSVRLIVTGDSPIPNAKSYSLGRLVREAKHELLVMGDSDVRVQPDLLARLAREMADPRVGLITCPYRAVGGRSLWSRLEAIGMNTELLGGVLVARMLEGMKFALGCTVAVRRSVLEEMGGFAYLQEFLAEDFVLGHRAAELGHEVLLSSTIIEHRIGSQSLWHNLSHRLRWARSTRRSRPLGYWGQAFTYPLPLALLLWATLGAAWPFVLLAVMLRCGAALATSEFVLRDRLLRRQWWLLPVQDVLGFLVWIGGFLGDTIVWGGRKCIVLRDGRLQADS